MGGWPVCEVWADRWVEREGKRGESGWPEGWVGDRCVRYGWIGG